MRKVDYMNDVQFIDVLRYCGQNKKPCDACQMYVDHLSLDEDECCPSVLLLEAAYRLEEKLNKK